MTTQTLEPTRRAGGRPFEVRATERIQVRSMQDGVAIIEGYASVSGVSYRVCDWLGEYDETIMPGAWGSTIAAGDDVRFLFDHAGMPYARTASGTLSLSEDSVGLKIIATLDATVDRVAELVSAIRRGDVSGMSVGMFVIREQWVTATSRQVLEAGLCDVSAVTFPASDTTSIAARSIRSALKRGFSAARVDKRMLHHLAQELRLGKMISSENNDILAGVLESILEAASDLTEASDELAELVTGVEGTEADPDAADEGTEATDGEDMSGMDMQTNSDRSAGIPLELALAMRAALPFAA